MKRAESHPEALKLRAALGFVMAKRQMARMLGPLYAIEEFDGVCCISMGLSHPRFNPMMVVLPPRDARAAIERARRFYRQIQKPFELTVIGDWAPSVLEAAEEAGLEPVMENPGMILAPLPAEEPGSAPEGLSVKRVRNADELIEYNDVVASGFGMERAATAAFDDAASLEALDIERYTGYVGHTAVVTGMRVSALRIASVFNVVTLPEFRKRGYGDWMTRLCAHEGAAEGCVASFLESTVSGYSLYLRVGYAHVFDVHCWREKE